MKKKRTAPEIHCDPQVPSYKGHSAYNAKCPVSNRPFGFCGSKAPRKKKKSEVRAQELCQRRDSYPVPNSPYALCGHKATLKNRAQELCERRGRRP